MYSMMVNWIRIWISSQLIEIYTFRCPVENCGYSCKFKSNLNRHVKRHHGDHEEKPFKVSASNPESLFTKNYSILNLGVIFKLVHNATNSIKIYLHMTKWICYCSPGRAIPVTTALTPEINHIAAKSLIQ